MTETLYRYYDNGELLYVGISREPVQRMRAHSKTAPWWERANHATFEHFETREAVQVAERAAIRDEKPLFNVVGTERREYRREDWTEPTLGPVPVVLGSSDPLERAHKIDGAASLAGVAASRLVRAIGDGELHGWRRGSSGHWRIHGRCLSDWVNGAQCEHIRAQKLAVAA